MGTDWILRCAALEDATFVWRGLFTGSWSLLARVDHEGRRYLFARRREAEPLAWESLTDNEREVVRRASLGQANKLIAHDLGCSASTVALRLSRAAHKLGLRSRVDVIQADRRRTPSDDGDPR